MEVRLDAKVPGTVLLRDEGSGAVHYITYNNIQQVRRVGSGLGCGRLLKRRSAAVMQVAARKHPAPEGVWPAIPDPLPSPPLPLLPPICINARQIDLTDDYVVMALFGDGGWEDQVRVLCVLCAVQWGVLCSGVCCGAVACAVVQWRVLEGEGSGVPRFELADLPFQQLHPLTHHLMNDSAPGPLTTTDAAAAGPRG